MSDRAVSRLACPVVLSSLLAAAVPCAAEAPFGVPADEGPHARVSLATEFEALTPGPQELAAVFTIDPRWHLYWINPGDSGLAPALELTLPDGIERLGPIRWPTPERYIHGDGELLDYIYEHELTLLIPVTVDESLLGHHVDLRLDATWLVCREECLPGEGSAGLSVRVAASPGEATPAARAVRAARRRIPVAPAPGDVAVRWDGLTLELTAPGAERVEFFPLEPRVGGPVNPAEEAAADGDRLRVAFDARVRDTPGVRGVLAVITGEDTVSYTIDENPPPAGR